MAAQFVNSDSDHDSEGATPIHHANPNTSSALQHAKSTPGQIFNNDSAFDAIPNPFDDDFGDNDPFSEDNPNNPFKNPFGTLNVNSNYKKNKQQKRTDATQREMPSEKRAKTPEMPPIFNASNDPNKNPFRGPQQPQHSRRHSQPVNAINPNVDLDDIFADFKAIASKPQQTQAQAHALQQPQQQHKAPEKKRSKSVFISRAAPPVESAKKSKRRASREDALNVSYKTGYDISYFVHRDIAYKYLCIICENVCRNVVELACKKKRHLCCKYCISKYFEIHGHKCPIHPEHSNLSYQHSRYSKYHIESLRVKCPYSTAKDSISGGCGWSDSLKHLDEHCVEHKEFVRCPFADYGCGSKLKIEGDDGDVLSEHLQDAQHEHLVLLLKKTKELSACVASQNKSICKLRREEALARQSVSYLSSSTRLGSNDNIWILCGSHKYWKHKYNQLFSVNLRNECKTAIRIYDIERMSNNSNVKTNVKTTTTTTPTTANGAASSIYDPTQSDAWDVGDLGVAHVKNAFDIPIWLQKKYPSLDVFNRARFNSIIFRCGGHLIRDKKVTARVDAILFDNHYTQQQQKGTSHDTQAIAMQQLCGYKLNCFPALPSKRYNCECVYSQRHGLCVVGGSGVDKNQINCVHQLKIRDEDVNITYNNEDEKQSKNKYPMNNTFNITLEWKSLSPILRAREDTAISMFCDQNIAQKEYMIICGGWSNGCLRTTELYNFERNKWIDLPPMNVKHNAAGITEWKPNNSIVIVGGFNTEAHFATEYFEMVKQKWIKLPNTNYKHRYKPAVWCKNNIICCAGSGVLKNEVGTVEYLDTRDNKWSTVKKPLAKLLGLNANINANNWRMWRIFT